MPPLNLGAPQVTSQAKKIFPGLRPGPRLVARFARFFPPSRKRSVALRVRKSKQPTESICLRVGGGETPSGTPLPPPLLAN